MLATGLASIESNDPVVTISLQLARTRHMQLILLGSQEYR